MRVLVVEDERFIAEPVAEILREHKYGVDLAFDGEDGLYQGLSGIYDVILLDIMLPKLDGLSVLRRLRSEGVNTPVLMLTAKGEVGDRVAGLDLGADDYLPKPFEFVELLARMRALTRRNVESTGDVLTFGDLSLNPYTAKLVVWEQAVTLYLKECQLLALLMRRKGMATPKELIMEKLWDLESEVGDANVEYHVSKLRKRLKEVGSHVQIKMMRGIGYVLEDSHER